MKSTKQVVAVLFFLAASQLSFGQDSGLLETIPTTKEGFVQSEKQVIATVNWLEETPLDQQKEKRKEQYALLTAWLTNAPTVTLEINGNVLDFTKKNSDLLLLFMGGWTKYALENNYSTDKIKCNVAGIRSAIKVYKKGIGLKKDKEMEKLIELDNSGELEKWVTEKLSKK